MVKLLSLPEDAFTPGKLEFVEPETWKNVGASLVHAIRLLKDHILESDSHNGQVKKFVDLFQEKVLQYLKDNDREVVEMKLKQKKDHMSIKMTVDE